jgi:hypothetical protein
MMTPWSGIVHAALSMRWVQIPGFPDYWVGSNGQIMSCRTKRPRILKGWAGGRRRDRFTVPLRNVKGAPPSMRTVHRIVCEAFHGPPPPDKNMACHIDGNALNNSANNLYWGDAYDNARDRWRKEDEDRLVSRFKAQGVPIVWTSGGELVPF